MCASTGRQAKEEGDNKTAKKVTVTTGGAVSTIKNKMKTDGWREKGPNRRMNRGSALLVCSNTPHGCLLPASTTHRDTHTHSDSGHNNPIERHQQRAERESEESWLHR